MYESKKSATFKIIGIILAVISVAAVFITEQIIKPGYWIKSAIKLVSFIGAIVIYSLLSKKRITDTINLRRLKKAWVLVICMFAFFIGTAILFFVLKDYIDLGSIRQSLIQKENLTKENCIFVFIYIIIFNSFLEESFFRGFVAHLFDNIKLGDLIASLLFSAYHIGIFVTWFSPAIFILCILGLALVGLFLQWLSEKFESIAASYITHACANIAINIIGALLIFEIIT